MAWCGGVCPECGGDVDQHDVRQIAMYHRPERPALIAVQYDCRHCQRRHWRHFRPSVWGRDEVVLLSGALAPCGRRGPQESKPPELSREPFTPPGNAITLDECLDFATRLAQLSAADLRALRESG